MAGACLFSIYISSIAVGVELKCHADVLDGIWVRWFWDLTCVFWAKNAKKIVASATKDADCLAAAPMAMDGEIRGKNQSPMGLFSSGQSRTLSPEKPRAAADKQKAGNHNGNSNSRFLGCAAE